MPPERITDLMGLRGDTSDNIPGVPGIGEKTASDLLQRFGTLERVLDSVDEISGAKRQENLRAHRDDALISKQLRRDRELAFYGSEDLTPSDFYKREDAVEARTGADEVVRIVTPFVPV